MTLDQLNGKLKGTDHVVILVSVDEVNGDSKAQYGWLDRSNGFAFRRGSISSLIAAAKEELGTRFIREHGLDTEIPADTLRTPDVTWTIPR